MANRVRSARTAYGSRFARDLRNVAWARGYDYDPGEAFATRAAAEAAQGRWARFLPDAPLPNGWTLAVRGGPDLGGSAPWFVAVVNQYGAEAARL